MVGSLVRRREVVEGNYSEGPVRNCLVESKDNQY